MKFLLNNACNPGHKCVKGQTYINLKRFVIMTCIVSVTLFVWSKLLTLQFDDNAKFS